MSAEDYEFEFPERGVESEQRRQRVYDAALEKFRKALDELFLEHAGEIEQTLQSRGEEPLGQQKLQLSVYLEECERELSVYLCRPKPTRAMAEVGETSFRGAIQFSSEGSQCNFSIEDADDGRPVLYQGSLTLVNEDTGEFKRFSAGGELHTVETINRVWSLIDEIEAKRSAV